MSQKWKIYTKTGDKGETSLIGGTRVPKYHDRIEAYGTTDELNSYLGLIRDMNIDKNTRNILIKIQTCLFTLESSLATDQKGKINRKRPETKEADIEFLETEIDKMNESLPNITSFVLPGGNIISSHCHIARTICRRAERITIKLSTVHPVKAIDIKYLNRLSDYLFVLARKFIHEKKGNEILWKPEV
jgi:cob(I)alamin adenosyltransferase